MVQERNGVVGEILLLRMANFASNEDGRVGRMNGWDDLLKGKMRFIKPFRLYFGDVPISFHRLKLFTNLWYAVRAATYH